MIRENKTPFFDGHNDVLLRLSRSSSHGDISSFFKKWEGGHLDILRMKEAQCLGGFFAVYVPEQFDDGGVYDDWMTRSEYALPLPPPHDVPYATQITLAQSALLLRMEREYPSQFMICRSFHDFKQAREENKIASIFHLEGADGIDPELFMLDVLYAAGLRSLGPVWSRPNIFGYGVPFRYPSSPDIGPGLTDRGKKLIRRCNKLGIMVDLSHLNEKGFWDAAQISDAPLVATHSAAHGICASSRNLTDQQLSAIRDSKGIVGLNFATAFIRPDGKEDINTPLDFFLKQFDYLIEHLGENYIGLGSDFDGATIPKDIGDVTGVPKLFNALEKYGFNKELIEKIAYKNWMSVLQRTWKE